MTVIGSGLGATVGFAQESTVGTAVTVTRWPFMVSEALKGKKNIAESSALTGSLLRSASHRAVVGFGADGQMNFEAQDRQLGLFFQNMLGVVPTITGSSVYTQTYALGNPTGMSFTTQVGRPTTAGVQEAFTYNGCKIKSWELSCSQGQIAKFTVDIDAWEEVDNVAYAATSTVASNSLNFTGGALTFAGTGPTGIVRSVSMKGTWGLATERRQIGSLYKSEQLVNSWLTLETTAVIEFANLTDVYAAYAADTLQQMVLSFTGPIVSGSTNSSITLTAPASFFNEGPPNVSGPDIVTQAVSVETLLPNSGAGLTLVYVTLDAAA
jgi:hypothetical protein